uniref:H(+)-transporting two-sector ATPase n=1 Tax=Silene conica TaxID=39875 RepID=G8E8V9_SILCO|nr:ATPase subunit 8 [Silene conica]AEO21079.1 ATPase subunit 8 [Silene conica]AEO21081.1 ATPase subunit 8 [Silene conica]
MPQLDQFTYFTQFFWSCVFFFGFYVLICNDRDGFLGICRILKLRNKLLSEESNKVLAVDLLPERAEEALLRKGFHTGSAYMYSTLSSASQWCQAADFFGKKTESTLISSFGEILGAGALEGRIQKEVLESAYSPALWECLSRGGLAEKNDITLVLYLNAQKS